METPFQRVHLVTGRLAERALRHEIERLANRLGISFTVQVLPISVAALLTPQWIAPRLEVPARTDRVLIPGYVTGDLEPLAAKFGVPVQRGPKDLRDLEEFLTGRDRVFALDQFDIEILAEINHCPKLTIQELLKQAKQLQADGADLIDLGCDPGQTWKEIGPAVACLKSHGLRLSIDSFDVWEVSQATRAGAELVLSVNSSNREHARDWGREVVVIPDELAAWERMEDTLEFLARHNVPFRVDPVLEPIGLGFAASLKRYLDARVRWPQVRLMMGIGNLTELSDADSAGINLLLMAICQETGIDSILTTQVINWARSSVRECDVARRLVKAAMDRGIPPKHISPLLVMLRDPKLKAYSPDVYEDLEKTIRDGNYRIFTDGDTLQVLGLEQRCQSRDPYQLFDQLWAAHPDNIDASHAFYLGYELCKAELAMQLGKQYVQDEPLRWGLLTPPLEVKHRISRRKNRGENNQDRSGT